MGYTNNFPVCIAKHILRLGEGRHFIRPLSDRIIAWHWPCAERQLVRDKNNNLTLQTRHRFRLCRRANTSPRILATQRASTRKSTCLVIKSYRDTLRPRAKAVRIRESLVHLYHFIHRALQRGKTSWATWLVAIVPLAGERDSIGIYHHGRVVV